MGGVKDISEELLDLITVQKMLHMLVNGGVSLRESFTFKHYQLLICVKFNPVNALF